MDRQRPLLGAKRENGNGLLLPLWAQVGLLALYSVSVGVLLFVGPSFFKDDRMHVLVIHSGVWLAVALLHGVVRMRLGPYLRQGGSAVFWELELACGAPFGIVSVFNAAAVVVAVVQSADSDAAATPYPLLAAAIAETLACSLSCAVATCRIQALAHSGGMLSAGAPAGVAGSYRPPAMSINAAGSSAAPAQGGVGDLGDGDVVHVLQQREQQLTVANEELRRQVLALQAQLGGRGNGDHRLSDAARQLADQAEDVRRQNRELMVQKASAESEVRRLQGQLEQADQYVREMQRTVSEQARKIGKLQHNLQVERMANMQAQEMIERIEKMGYQGTTDSDGGQDPDFSALSILGRQPGMSTAAATPNQTGTFDFGATARPLVGSLDSRGLADFEEEEEGVAGAAGGGGAGGRQDGEAEDD